ncbi:hypothetical protein GCM10022235_01240 [Kribbella ginsengisoli]|uniref:IrrE N-terminal-like domain-containing protein n=2 Tax=Kribbella ginsengisoli TaxID=363865 RepID=A0ABP6VQQ4_9ACTN
MTKMNVSAEVLHTVLTQEIRKVNSGVGWARWLDAAALFPTYGFGNAVLINLQMPHANFIAGAPAWARLGRQVVKSGAIKILAPVRAEVLFEDEAGEPTMDPQGSIRQGIIGFKVANVWDVAHTVGPRISLPAMVSQGTTVKLWDALVGDSRAHGLTVDVRWTAPEMDSYTDHGAGRIVVSNRLDLVAKVARLAHEVGHLRMHPGQQGKAEACYGIEEVEADSFAHIALARFGLPMETSSFDRVLLLADAVQPRSPESVIKAIGTRAVVASRRFLEATGHQISPMPKTIGKRLEPEAGTQAPYLGPEL